MVKILVFDTETTDKPPEMSGKNWDEREKTSKKLLSYSDFTKKKSSWSKYISSWPSIIQLSYILYDTEDPEDAKIFNKYIDIPDEVKISEGSLAIHHITKEKIASVADVNRAKIYDALDEFMDDISRADVVVGHNVQFDRKMIIAELTRVSKEHNINQIEQMMDDNHFECTMEKTKPICNLKIRYGNANQETGFYKIKSPKLMESYKHYFGYEPNGEALHDALIDVVVCLRVYCMSLEDSFDVCGTNPIITDYIMRISPPGYICESTNNSKKSASKRVVSKRAPSVKSTKKQKLSTIIEESIIVKSKTKSKTKTDSNPKSKTKTDSNPKSKTKTDSNPKSKSKSKTKSKSKSVKSKSKSVKSKSKSVKSKSVKNRKSEMSNFIVPDKKSIW